MQETYSELRCKEVINVCDGQRLGCVSDLELELPAGRILALIVPGPRRFLGLLGKEFDYCIPWPCIKRIGADLILVDVAPEQIRRPVAKKQAIC